MQITIIRDIRMHVYVLCVRPDILLYNKIVYALFHTRLAYLQTCIDVYIECVYIIHSSGGILHLLLLRLSLPFFLYVTLPLVYTAIAIPFSPIHHDQLLLYVYYTICASTPNCSATVASQNRKLVDL